MAVFQTEAPQRFAGFISFAPFQQLLEAFTIWGEERRTQIALLNLSDRELHDIGLTRSDVLDRNFTSRW